MRRHALIALATVTALSLPLVGCGSGTSGNGGGTAQQSATSEGFDAVESYWGQWRGSVETTGTSVYGTTGGSEQMLDIDLGKDGGCTVEPLEAHADLPSHTGTWEGTESEIVLHLDDAGDVTLTVVSSAKLEGNAADFGIADFDTINFTFYG